MIIDHVGIVVSSLERGIDVWEEILDYRRLTEPVVNARQKVRVVFLQKRDSCLIKLIEPIDAESPVFAMAARGGGLHHLCFRTNEVTSALVRVERGGGRIIVHPQPGEAFENEPIAFAYLHGVAMEFIDTDKKACKIQR